MTFTSSPGFSLMLEGISYIIGAELPGVFVNVMRPGPGLGYIGPEQSDVKLACRGLGHGNTHAIVLAPTSPQETLDLTLLAFELSFKAAAAGARPVPEISEEQRRARPRAGARLRCEGGTLRRREEAGQGLLPVHRQGRRREGPGFTRGFEAQHPECKGK